ncbi:hypothetical protein KFE25_012887 [Diacronema lutheri]|uniref:Phosphatidic acid phosphatase type 2/haloperoxidase domain-containing protein n=1 Tax=Diacronema lutheri TaxID=2081491 RepID=A0A8J5XDL5_DIALT|nr:hypothetical protein KFE25_012887 [Diacronema lutheri]
MTQAASATTRPWWWRLWLAQTRYVVSLAAFCALVARDDARVTFCVAGAVGNALGNKLLKRLIAQARPSGSALHDPGMPSSHASSLFFFAAFIALALLRHPPAYGLPSAAALVALAACAARHRVAAGFHTPAQVAVGALVGASAATIWHELARPRLEPFCAGRGAALAVAGVVGVGVLSNAGQELLGTRAASSAQQRSGRDS